MEKETKICLFIFIGSFIFYLATIQNGLLSTDENAYLHLSRSIAERFPQEFLEQDEYFKGKVLTENTGWASPAGFFVKNGHIYAGVHLGFPLLSSPFYWLLGPLGLKIFNSLITSLTLVIIYFGAKKLFDKNTAYLAVVLYLFTTFSMFYATSLWHHTLATMGYILAQVSFLYMDRGAKVMALFVLGSAIAVWAASYMLFPLSILFFLVLRKGRKGSVIILLIFILLSISWVYNIQVFHSFHGKSPPGTDSIIKFFSDSGRILDNLVAMFIYREHVIDPWGWWKIQKSLLESSPFLILSIIGLTIRRPWPLIISNFFYLVMVVNQTTPDFGGYEFSMRYLLPIIPFGTILSAAFISKLFNEHTTKFLVILLSLSTVVFYASGLETDSRVLSLFFSASLMIFSLFYYKKKNEAVRILLTILLLVAMLHSNFVNITDVKTGNQQREYQSHFEKVVEGLTNEGSTLFLPRFFPWETTSIDGRTSIYYQHSNLPDEGRKESLEKILSKVPTAYIVLWEEDMDAIDVTKKHNATFRSLTPYVTMATVNSPSFR